MTTPFLDENYIRVGPLALIRDILEIYTDQNLALFNTVAEMEHRSKYGHQKPYSKADALSALCRELGISVQIYQDPVPTIEITLS